MMEQPRVSWTHSLCCTLLMYLQLTRSLSSRNTSLCSSPPCREAFPCSSSQGCGSVSDPCLSDPCPRNATCQVTLDTETYECRCPAGFKGRNCEIPMKRCSRNLCRHGGQCYVTDRGSTCFCAVGYKGTFCETPEDECLWNPCQNGAVCRERGNGQACYCVPGFQGALCDIEVNECISQPCQHGGTCLNQIGSYGCVCPPQYTGRDCEMEYDACTSSPCLNGASCLHNAGSFSCECAAGFSGDLCDVNIDECASSPCLNGGRCVDGSDGYICDCSMVGFTGVNGETPAPLCSSQPCHNSATCLEDSGSFQCLCWPGYTGPLCETYIPMCESQPCKHGAECMDLIWVNMSRGQVNTQDKSKAYICKCGNGFLGVHCEQDIDECQSNPCRNGGTCENLLGSYTCHCPTSMLDGRYYGGPDCTQVLTGCKEHICQNGGSCLPYMMDYKHHHTCVCVPGFTGPYCETQTTLSFNGRSVLPLTLPPQRTKPFNVSLTFRTVQTSAALLHLRDRAAAVRLYLQSGSLFLSLHRSSRLITLLHLPYNVSDDLWHTVEIIFQDDLHLRLLDPSCGSSCVNQSGLGDTASIEFQEIFLGGEPSAQGTNMNNVYGNKTQFVGCLRDVTVGSIIVTEEDGKLANIGVGCKRRDHCESCPCGDRGECINLWLNYHCDCHRPYRGDNCSTESEAAGFGSGDVSSYAAFHARISHNDDVVISAFVRTRHDTGVLFATGNSTDYDIVASLESGRLTVRSGDGVVTKGEHRISDGRAHLVTMKLGPNKLDLFSSLLPLDGISADVTRGQDTSFLYVGGSGDRLETLRRGGYFKGCVQDLRIDDTALTFFTGAENSGNSVLVNVTRGCDNDTGCKPGHCQNGSACDGADGNDCSCSSDTAGKTCEDRKWCQISQCPPGSVCQPVPGGYECISNALFRGDGRAISFRSNGKIMRDLTNLTIGFRTVDSESVLLHAQREPEFIRIKIQNTFLLFHLQSSNDLDAVSLVSREPVSDSRWHTVTLSMTAPESQSSTWQMELDGKPQKSISSLSTGNLNFLREGTDIYLGVDMDGIYRNFTGCLGTVLIEGIHLPYFADTDYPMAKPQEEQFVKTSPEMVDIRCLASDPCASNPCLFGGSCRDVFTRPVCTCPKGRSGDFCETTECLPNPCAHGNCTPEDDGYRCDCEAGYTGPNCDFMSCHGHLCAKGATCIGGAKGHFCLCPPNVTGQHCRYNVLPSIFCGDEKKNITCYNYSNCTETQGVLGCSCRPGFTGQRCEIDINECESNPCLNGGICQNLPNRFHCICDMNFAGDSCEIDVSDLSFYVSMLLWQNLFQLLSYLILRMEDEPAVEWGEQDYDE